LILFGLVDGAHTAFTNDPQDSIVSDHGAGAEFGVE
jgi:hypothetical protein